MERYYALAVFALRGHVLVLRRRFCRLLRHRRRFLWRRGGNGYRCGGLSVGMPAHAGWIAEHILLDFIKPVFERRRGLIGRHHVRNLIQLLGDLVEQFFKSFDARIQRTDARFKRSYLPSISGGRSRG